jgi:glycerol-3-phosphate acyltransferase PlsX
MKIALDAMGGDFAPEVTVTGAIEAVNEYDVAVVLVGDEGKIISCLGDRRYPADKISILHATQVAGMDEAPSVVLRKKKDASIRRAIELVKRGEADAAVSAGNSGVAMAMGHVLLGAVEGIDRPAIATVMPALTGFILLIDAGATVDCKPRNLLEFAYMGNTYHKAVFGNVREPRIGLLSIGEEDSKGNELTKETFKLLKASRLNFIGNVEGKDVLSGKADIIVCDGFIGNVVLKTSEGVQDVIMKMLKFEIANMKTGRLGYLMIKPALRNFKKRTDYDEYGGAPLLGINGTCIISHGRSSAKAIRHAIRVAAEMSRQKVHDTIAQTMKELSQKDNVND